MKNSLQEHLTFEYSDNSNTRTYDKKKTIISDVK